MKQFSERCSLLNRKLIWAVSLWLLVSPTARAFVPNHPNDGVAPMVLSLGNRVFQDLNRNGIQDIDDPGIANVPVRLFQSGIQRGQTTTDANGLYTFNSSNVSVGLLPNTPYEIRIFSTEFPTNLTLTRRDQGDDATDSDAQLVGNQAVIFLTTNSSDSPNDSYDFGFSAGDPDLNIIKSATASQVTIGSNATFTIQVNNTGGGVATNVVVKDTLDAGLAYVSSSPAPTITTTASSQTVLTWSLGTLLSGGSSGINLTVNAVGEGVLYNTAYVTTTDTEANTRNNVSRACVTVPIILCPGDQYVASLPAQYANVTWYRNAEATPVATGNSFTITQAGSYSFTTTAPFDCPANGCCPIIIEDGIVPVLAITPASPAICLGNSTTLAVSGCETGTILWSSGETTASITVSPTITSIYSVTCSPTSRGTCAGIASTTVTVNPNPVVTLSSATICVGATASLTATGAGAPGLTYQFSAGLTPDPAQPGVATVLGVTAGTTAYTVTATSSDGCSATATGSVTVNPTPTVTLSSATICVGATASLTATGAGAPGLTYQFSAGLTPDPAQPGVATVLGVTAGTTAYTVTATSSDGCSATATGSVTVNPTPTVTLSSATICVGATASLTATGAGAPGLTYQFSAGLTPDPAQPGVATVLGTVAGTTAYTVTATSSDGCSATATGSVTVNPTPTVTLSSATICVGATASLTATGAGAPGLTYQFSAGLTPDPAQPGVATVLGTVAGTTAYTVTATSSDGCSATATGSVTVNPTPTVTLSSATICVGATASLTATGAGAPGLTYQFSAGLTPDPAQPGVATVLGTVAGTTAYTVTATSSDGCSATATGSVTVNPTPTVTLSSATICVGATASLTATGAGAPGLTYQFSAGLTPDPAQPGVATVLGTVAGTTAYTVTATSSDGCSATATGSVTVNPTPTVTLSSATICVGATASLTATGAGAPGLTYQFSAGLTPDPAQPGVATVLGVTAGTTAYTVTATSSDGCSATATGSVTVNPTPTVTLSSATICVGATASLTATGAGAPGLTYQFSAGLTPDPAQPGVATVLGVTAGTTAYTVTATSSDGCSATATGSVTVNPTPTVTLSSATICVGATASLTATGAGAPGLTYQFSAGLTPDPAQPGVATVLGTVAGTTAYTVTATSSDGCSATATGSVTVNPTPTVTLSSATICVGATASLTATGAGAPGLTYQFSAGLTPDPAQPGVATVLGTVAGTTAYTVTATSSDGCSATATGSVTVNPTPTVTLSSATICVGATASLTATGAGAPGLTYQFSAGLTPDPAQPGVATVLGVTAGTTAYTVTATSSDGCSATATGSVTVNPTPTVTLSSATICVGATASLTATGAGAPGLTYQFSAGLTPDPAQPGVATVLGVTAGTTAYTVTATSSDGCSATATGSVTVNPTPTVTLSSATICVGATASLTATGAGAPGLTYQFSAGLTPDPAQPGVATVLGVTAGTTAYTVTATSSDGCSATATGSVTVNPTPTVTLSSATICVGATASLTATGAGAPGLTYQFSAGLTPDPAQPGVATVLGTVAGTTAYTVTATSSDGCSATATGSVTVNPTPTVTLSSATICVGATASLTATGAGAPGLTYQFSAGLTPDPAQPGVATVLGVTAGTTAYTVTATSSDGCSATATGSVTVNPTPTASITVSSATICQGESTTLTASGGTTYRWSTGEQTAVITVTTSGVYSVTVSNEFGCSDVTSTSITVNPAPVLTVNSPTIFTGQSATLTIGGCEGGTLVWSTGENTASLIVAPLVTTTYSATCTFPTGCSSTTSTTVTVNPGPTYITAPVAIAATCTGAVANNNARIELTTLENTERVDVSLGSTYTGPAYGAASNVVVTSGAASITNLPNPASPQPYTVRLFSPGGVYFIDVTVTLSPAECICPAPKCVPIVIRKIR